jgi:hypothetical protein
VLLFFFPTSLLLLVCGVQLDQYIFFSFQDGIVCALAFLMFVV